MVYAATYTGWLMGPVFGGFLMVYGVAEVFLLAGLLAAFLLVCICGCVGLNSGISGPIADWYGRRGIFLGGIVVYGFFSSLSAMSKNLTQMIVYVTLAERIERERVVDL